MRMKLAYSVPEAAHTLSVSRATLYRLMADNILPFVKVGSRTVLLHTDLVAFLNR